MKLVRSWDFSGARRRLANRRRRESRRRFRHAASVRHRQAGRHQDRAQRAGRHVPAGNRDRHPLGRHVHRPVDDRQAARTFDDARSARRSLPAGDGGSTATPIAISADGELTGLRIFVDDDQSVLPIDAVRLFSAEGAGDADVKLQKAKATFSQDGYDVQDGDRRQHRRTKPTMAGRSRRNSAAITRPRSSWPSRSKARRTASLELMIHQNFQDGQHSLGRFRISVTDAAPPLNFGLPADDRGDPRQAGRQAHRRRAAEFCSAQLRRQDKDYQELQADLAAAQQAVPAKIRT